MKVGDLVKNVDGYTILTTDPERFHFTKSSGIITGIGIDHYGEQRVEVFWFDVQRTSLVPRAALEVLCESR